MYAVELEEVSVPATWVGLGKDVLGLCSVCHKQRTLEVQHIPTDGWICRPCFNAYWRDADGPVE